MLDGYASFTTYSMPETICLQYVVDGSMPNFLFLVALDSELHIISPS